jgi:transposase
MPNLSRNLIRIWVRKYEEGAVDDEAQAADLIQAYEVGSRRSSA